jgi:UDP-N-acetyl-D-mannosaminuronate dehydrogenase
VFDPKTRETFGGQRTEDIWDSLSISDALVIVTDHDEFKKLDISKIKNKMKKLPILVDTRRIFQRSEVEALGIEYISIGYKKPQT